MRESKPSRKSLWDVASSGPVRQPFCHCQLLASVLDIFRVVGCVMVFARLSHNAGWAWGQCRQTFHGVPGHQHTSLNLQRNATLRDCPTNHWSQKVPLTKITMLTCLGSPTNRRNMREWVSTDGSQMLRTHHADHMLSGRGILAPIEEFHAHGLANGYRGMRRSVQLTFCRHWG